MKQGRDLESLAREIMRQAAAKQDMVGPVANIEMQSTDQGLRLSLGDKANFGVRPIAHDQLATYVGIPKQYYERMQNEAPKLLADNVNRWLHDPQGQQDRRLVRALDGNVRAFLSDRYRPLENGDLAEAVLPVMFDLKLQVISCEITERRLYIKAVHQSIQRDLPKGVKMGDGSHHIFDTCVPAISVSNSEVGFGRLSVETGMLTRACTNLAFFSQAGMKRRHVGARHDLASEGFEELLSDRTRKLTDQAIWAQINDVVKGAFNEVQFDKQIARIAETTTQKIDGDPVKVVEFTAKKFGMTDKERGSVLEHLFKGGDPTRYGLFNAITRAGADFDDYDRATDFERMGPMVIDLPANEWKEIATQGMAAQGINSHG